jgi:hypothetical protein
MVTKKLPRAGRKMVIKEDTLEKAENHMEIDILDRSRNFMLNGKKSKYRQ